MGVFIKGCFSRWRQESSDITELTMCCYHCGHFSPLPLALPDVPTAVPHTWPSSPHTGSEERKV